MRQQKLRKNVFNFNNIRFIYFSIYNNFDCQFFCYEESNNSKSDRERIINPTF